MRDLTSGVAALRDGFAKEGRDRAAAIRGRLVAYALDRREAIAAWREASATPAGHSAKRVGGPRRSRERRQAVGPWTRRRRPVSPPHRRIRPLDPVDTPPANRAIEARRALHGRGSK